MLRDLDKLNIKEKEELLKQIVQDLKQTLSEDRYLHSISTMKKAKELSKKYNEDEQIVMITAVAHDIAKEISKEELINYAIENNVTLSEDDKLIPMVLHGIIGAHILARKYGFTKEMQEAVYYHTTGRANMSILDKIIYIADKSEERRNSEHVKKLRKITIEEGLEEAILFVIDDWTIPKALENEKLIHPNSIYARNDILSKLK